MIRVFVREIKHNKKLIKLARILYRCTKNLGKVKIIYRKKTLNQNHVANGAFDITFDGRSGVCNSYFSNVLSFWCCNEMNDYSVELTFM